MNMHAIPSFDLRNAFRDPRSAWFQDDIRRAMLKARTPGQVAAVPPSVRPAAIYVPTHRDNLRAVLLHLVDGEDGRTGINASVGLPEKTLERVLLDLREMGHIDRRRRDRAALYCITRAGLDAVSAPVSVVQEAPQEEPKGPRKSRGPTAANVDAVFAVLSMQPATRAALQRACGVGSSTVEECLRVLREQDVILWVRTMYVLMFVRVSRTHRTSSCGCATRGRTSKRTWCANEARPRRLPRLRRARAVKVRNRPRIGRVAAGRR